MRAHTAIAEAYSSALRSSGALAERRRDCVMGVQRLFAPDRPNQSREVAKLPPDLRDRILELTGGDRSALLQTMDLVRHG